MDDAARERVIDRFREDLPFWCEQVGRIVDKSGELVPFVLNEGQRAFDAELEAQRASGKPMRAIVLKARQMGFSTVTQAKLIHRATQRERYKCVTVAHDRNTGRNLYRMAETFWANLPDPSDPAWAGLKLKPELGNYSRGSMMRFGPRAQDLWSRGGAFPDSEYIVDTASEFEAGRGGTYRALHLSELAFWANITFKLTALLQGVPDDPESLVVLESTPNGHNEFKDIWDDAVEGRSAYIPFFWPWHKHAGYTREFANDDEKAAFVVGDGPYGEQEPDLVRDYGLSLEQLFWRRETIATKCGGDVRVFHQEYPSNAEEGFLSSGQKVFDPYRVSALIRHTEMFDPKQTSPDNPGPEYGIFEPGETEEIETMLGTVRVPTSAVWVPREEGEIRNQPWRLWLPKKLEGREFIAGVDVSGGKMESTDKPDYQAMQVIDHETREQVAEYQSRVEPDEFAIQVLLAALFFNQAWVAVERTGGYGLPVINKLFKAFQYPYLYRAKMVGSTSQKTMDKLGWDTNLRTKPLLIAGLQARLREDDFAGIKSARLAGEINSYVRDEKGRANAAPKAFDDLLVAFMIAQYVAAERPLMNTSSSDGQPATAFRAAPAGLSAYDPR